MRSLNKGLLLIGLLLASVSFAPAGVPDDIVGVWYNQEKDAKIEIYRCGDTYCGKIVWLQEPLYPEGSKDGIPGTIKLDHNNPDPARRKTPVMGMTIMHGFAFSGENQWKKGKIYDPKNGKTYSGRITLISSEKLDLRGYIGISLIGRTATWSR
ncbi:MAG TPA: DUF2147 domain-containing protein [Nitrospirota bacterium]|nr:DUF2147 domain-containing protein [Nitrospirota bacterium]